MVQSLEAYWERLQALHADLLTAIDGLPPAALDWSPGPEINSIAVLVTHIAASERFWIGEKVGGRPAQRDRASEFVVAGLDIATLRRSLIDSEALAGTVLEELTDADMERIAGTTPQGYTYTAAWALWHALEHVAQHLGHIQLMRQWWVLHQSGLTQD